MLAAWGVSIRRACQALKFDTSTYHYKSRRLGQAGLESRIKEICQTRVRFDPNVVDRKALEAAVNALSDTWKPRPRATRTK